MSFGQGGPFDGPGGSGSTPDWEALAEQSQAGARRKRWLMIGGGALAALAVAGIVVTAMLVGGTSDNKHPDDVAASGSGAPEPHPSFSDVSVPPPPNPRDYITDRTKDRAPLTTAALFPDKAMVLGEHTYPRTAASASKDCTSGTQGALGSLLKHNGCEALLRATYAKDGVAVTIGIAALDSADAAERVKAKAQGNLAPLAGGHVGEEFCRGTACRMTANATGRYAYFTIAGYLDGKRVTETSAPALQIGRDGESYAFARIIQRGKDQAAKAAQAQERQG
ncbi:hypothetical protein OG422_12845 [Streptomyces sp. NBC_01525]|uniref:hypothetical protein n=1 Tax=Streptomyces TaxID=1883 RepID=UPI00163DA8AE|nr:hypothetical protein [Streptomyces benahoarensis]